MDGSTKNQIVSILQEANNILVTVSSNPTVDQLAAMIALTLLLNKADKHGAAVFSGQVPSTLEFLEPDQTVEKNTDSLRDFIISLDKSKADKLRYKVEDDVVKIFITPYKTSLTGTDFEFSQGDFNVEVVVALGVTKRDDLDKAITSHGRILHDAKVITLSNSENTGDLGSINWQDSSASSLCEMVTTLVESMQAGLLDGQISTALLTGIVAETERFRNARTSPRVMTLAAELMGAGANQQLIATQLESNTPVEFAHTQVDETSKVKDETEQNDSGVLRLDHENEQEKIDVVEDKKELVHEEVEEPELAEVLPMANEEKPIDEKQEEKEETKAAEAPVLPTLEEPEQKTQEQPLIVPEVPLITVPQMHIDAAPLIEPNQQLNDGTIHIDEHGNVMNPPAEDEHKSEATHSTINHGIKVIEPLAHDTSNTLINNSMALEPPKHGGDLNALLAQANEEKPMGLELNEGTSTINAPALDFSLHAPAETPKPEQDSPQQTTPETVDGARQNVQNIIDNKPYDANRPEPIKSLNAQPIDLEKSVAQKEEEKTENTQSPPPLPPPIIAPMQGGSTLNPYLNPAPQQNSQIITPPVMPQ